MENCCNSNFYSDTLNVPSCTLACLSAASPGSVFVGADGSVWILNGIDPCNITNWTQQNDCCIRITNPATGFVDLCCGDNLNVISSDESVTIDLSTGELDITIPTTVGNDPLPVATFEEYVDGLAGELDGCASTSTEDTVTLSYQWNVTGPAAVTLANATACATDIDFSEPGLYEVTLTVTDSNGNANAVTKTICVEPRSKCESYFLIPDIAFADTGNPTDAEVFTYVSAQDPSYNNGTLFYYGGTSQNPQYVWQFACTA